MTKNEEIKEIIFEELVTTNLGKYCSPRAIQMDLFKKGLKYTLEEINTLLSEIYDECLSRLDVAMIGDLNGGLRCTRFNSKI